MLARSGRKTQVKTEDSYSESKHEIDYKSPLKYYSQIQTIKSSDHQIPLHVILPNGNICLGYTIEEEKDESCDVVDSDVWLYTHPSESKNLLFYIRLILTILLISDIIIRSIVTFGMEADIKKQEEWYFYYYSIMIITSVTSAICIWFVYLRLLCLFFSIFIVEMIFSLLWICHILQFVNWIIICFICYLISRYFHHSFGKWYFLLSQARLDELEHLN